MSQHYYDPTRTFAVYDTGKGYWFATVHKPDDLPPTPEAQAEIDRLMALAEHVKEHPAGEGGYVNYDVSLAVRALAKCR